MVKNLLHLIVISLLLIIAPQICHSQPSGLAAEASMRRIRSQELEPYTSQQLRLMRDEIYARHGYVFKDKKLQRYFSRTPWYRPRGNNRLALAELNPIERKNIELIRSWEQAKVTAPRPGSAWMGRWPETSVFIIRTDDLLHLSTEKLRIMRTEIYARHGYVFDDPDLREYFASQSWYRPRGDNNKAEAALKPVERRNIEIIRAQEEANVEAPYPGSASMGRWPETSIYLIRYDDLLIYSASDLRLMRN
jgi:hypothetical protein